MINKEQHVFLLQFGINSTHECHNCTPLRLVQLTDIRSLLIPNCTQKYAVTYTYRISLDEQVIYSKNGKIIVCTKRA